MSNNHPEDPEFVPDEAEGEGSDPTMFEVPDDASALIDGAPPTLGVPVEEVPAQAQPTPAASETDVLKALVAERTADLQRLHAEYRNYKRRVDRDRDVARAKGVESVVRDLLPVLDSIEAARQHDELTGGFKLVADELDRLAARHGLVVYGEVGEPFDPNIHEALMHVPLAGDHDVTVISVVMQKGVRLNDRIIRPARVGVADPE